MNILGFPVIGQVKMKSGQVVPLVDIPMMSDERWNQEAEELAKKHFREHNGREAVNSEEALSWQRKWIDSMEVI